MKKLLVFYLKKGISSYITPAVFLSQHYFKNIRTILLKECNIQKILLLNYKVFLSADTGDTAISFIKGNNVKNAKIKYAVIRENEAFKKAISFNVISQKECLLNDRYENNLNTDNFLFKKITNHSIYLSEIAKCTMGIKPYQKGKGTPQTEGKYS